MVLRQSSCTSCWIASTFLGAEFMWRSPWPLIIFEWCSFSLEALMPLETFPYAHHIISKVLAPDLLSFTQNLTLALCSSITSMLKSQIWRHTWWQTLVLCNSQCSHSNATRHTEWHHSLLPSIAHAFTYCHWFAFYGTSPKTFLYTYISVTYYYALWGWLINWYWVLYCEHYKQNYILKLTWLGTLQFVGGGGLFNVTLFEELRVAVFSICSKQSFIAHIWSTGYIL